MPIKDAKIYNDGSHFIAIPPENFTSGKHKKQPPKSTTQDTKKQAFETAYKESQSLVEPKIASDFMARFDYAWACACQNKFDYTKAIQVRLDGKSTSIVFFSIGRRELSSKDYYQILCDAKQQQHKADAVLLIVFIGNENGQCRNDWVYFEKEYVADDKVLKFYEEIGMFNGLMDFDIYEQLCEKMLKN